MKPLLSRSSEIDRVMGSDGDPAITTTSSLAPLLARFALRFLRLTFLFMTLYVTPPIAKTITVVKILCLYIQLWSWASTEGETDMSNVRGGGGGGLGRADSGIHLEDESASLSVFETFSRCLST